MVTQQTYSVAAARSDGVLKKYSPCRVKVPIGGQSLSLVLPDAASLIRRGLWAAEGPAEPPYWQEVWPASVAAARAAARLCRNRVLRVLDLGCGLALPGMAAAVAGATVSFADLEPDAFAFVRWNLAHLAPSKPYECKLVDWSREVLGGLFDLMILSDVSYRPVHHLALWRHIDECLAPGGIVLHCDPYRREADPFVAGLHRRLRATEERVAVLWRGRQSWIRQCTAIREAASTLQPAQHA